MSTLTLGEDAVYSALREVIDPELGMNLVELGLIYSVEISGANVSVRMTLTTPGCPMHDRLANGVEHAVRKIEGVQNVAVEVVWDQPWDPSMMHPEARARLGM